MARKHSAKHDPDKDLSNLSDIADQAASRAREARDSLSDMADRAQREAVSAGRSISTLVVDEIDRRGAVLAEGLQQIAGSVRDAGEKAGGAAPQVVAQAVTVMDDLSARLRSGSVRDLGDRIARFGRDNPGTLALAALAAGVLAGRFLIGRGRHVAAGPADAPAAAPPHVALPEEGAYARP